VRDIGRKIPNKGVRSDYKLLRPKDLLKRSNRSVLNSVDFQLYKLNSERSWS